MQEWYSRHSYHLVLSTLRGLKQSVFFFVAKRRGLDAVLDAEIIRTEKGAGGSESPVMYSTWGCFRVENL